jgi:hypothetical protein
VSLPLAEGDPADEVLLAQRLGLAVVLLRHLPPHVQDSCQPNSGERDQHVREHFSSFLVPGFAGGYSTVGAST